MTRSRISPTGSDFDVCYGCDEEIAWTFDFGWRHDPTADDEVDYDHDPSPVGSDTGHVMINLRLDVLDAQKLLRLGRESYRRSARGESYRLGSPDAGNLAEAIPDVESAAVELLVEAWIEADPDHEGAVDWGDVDNKEFYPA